MAARDPDRRWTAMVSREDVTSAVREKFLSIARELFYQEGIRAVGVDTIVERSGASKTSLYRWFPTKDDLIAAFLEKENAEFWAYWEKVASKYSGRPREEMLAHLKWIAGYIGGKKFRGCPFLNAAAEFPNPAHKARAVCRANKSELKHRLAALAKDMGASEPERLGNQLTLLIDGAFSNSQALGKAGPATELLSAGEALIEASTKFR
jgi:AcrR family transcriptional regulator